MSLLYPDKLTWVLSPKVLKQYHLNTIDGLIYTTDKENENKSQQVLQNPHLTTNFEML